jgi:mevalonate kinase
MAVLQHIDGDGGQASHGYRLNIRLTSTIPSAAGLGSGTAVSVALARALSAHLGHPMSNDDISAIAFEVDRLHHGTPSGIDNTVVTFGRPVFFQQGKPIEFVGIGAMLTLVIADTGVRAPTKESVADVRRLWEGNKPRWEAVFAHVGEIVLEARRALESGDGATLGGLMNKNHGLLQEMTVSSGKLDALVRAAREADAWGAKMSGGGRGGSMLALVEERKAAKVEEALWEAGARRVIITRLGDAD